MWLGLNLVSLTSKTLLGLVKTTASETNKEEKKQTVGEKSTVRIRDWSADAVEWKADEVIKKESRVDEDRYQAVVPCEANGKKEDLEVAVEAVAKRCQYNTENSIKANVIDDFLQFVHWLTNEQTCSSANGP